MTAEEPAGAFLRAAASGRFDRHDIDLLDEVRASLMTPSDRCSHSSETLRHDLLCEIGELSERLSWQGSQ